MLSAPLCVTQAQISLRTPPKRHHHLVHNLATTSQCAYVFMCAGFVYIYTPIRADAVAVVRWRVCTRARAHIGTQYTNLERFIPHRTKTPSPPLPALGWAPETHATRQRARQLESRNVACEGSFAFRCGFLMQYTQCFITARVSLCLSEMLSSWRTLNAK